MKTIGLIGGMSWESSRHYRLELHRVISDELRRDRDTLDLVRTILVIIIAGALVACAPGKSMSGSDGGGGSAGSGGAPLGVPETGVATYYDATGAGACSFDPTPNDLDVAAMDMPEWNGSAPCGECVTVTGPKGNVTVRIVDLCPGCEKGHLDLSMQAFAAIADISAGRVPITWQVVPCAVSGNLAYRYKEGSSQYWTAIQVRNHRLPVKSLEVELGGAWQTVARSDYNYFVDAMGVGTTGGFRVRVTASDGQQLVDALPPVQSALVAGGAAQFQ
jgi:expansin (peptidoglycan-binding protein)